MPPVPPRKSAHALETDSEIETPEISCDPTHHDFHGSCCISNININGLSPFTLHSYSQCPLKITVWHTIYNMIVLLGGTLLDLCMLHNCLIANDKWKLHVWTRLHAMYTTSTPPRCCLFDMHRSSEQKLYQKQESTCGAGATNTVDFLKPVGRCN